MIRLSTALSPRLLLMLLVVLALLLMAVVFLGHLHLGGSPILAQSSMAVLNEGMSLSCVLSLSCFESHCSPTPAR